MATAAKVTPPQTTVTDSLPKDGVKKDEAQKALDDLWGALAGSPLNVKRP